MDRVDSLNVSWNPTYIPHRGVFYVQATQYKGTIDGKPKYGTISLHRFIMNVDGNFDKSNYVDHFDYNTLNNRKNNLRLVDNSINNKHRATINYNNTTGEKNVSYSKRDNEYTVQFYIDKKSIIYGRFGLHEFDKAVDLARKLDRELYGNISRPVTKSIEPKPSK